MSTPLLSVLPEVILTVFGVVIMLAEPMIPVGRSRKPLGWLAVLGTFAAGVAALYQHSMFSQFQWRTISAFYGTVQVDDFSVFFHLLIAAIVLATLLGTLNYFDGTPNSHAGEFYALTLFGATGMMFMTCSVELLMVFVGLEISSISTYILAGFRKGQASASESSLKYFLLGSFATSFFLYGIALCFGATGSTSIAGIHSGMATTTTPSLGILAIAMVIIGLGFKVSLAPFHVWTPDVYQGAPTPVVGMMSTAPKAAAFAVLLRFLFNGMPALRPHWIILVELLAVASMCIGNLGALLQRDVKRLLAYSSIAHAGYLLVAFSSTRENAISAALFYTAAYSAMNVGAFLVLTAVSGYGEESRTLDDYTGLALHRPVLAALLSFFLISLIGIPFTGGFFGKFYSFTAAMYTGHVWLVVIGLINSGIACFYYLRLLAALYTRPATAAGTPEEARKVAAPAGIALACAALATLLLGIAPGRLLHLTQRSTPVTLPAANPLNQPTGTQSASTLSMRR
jgi:NADH-quinone oxidoreductase subunit N